MRGEDVQFDGHRWDGVRGQNVLYCMIRENRSTLMFTSGLFSVMTFVETCDRQLILFESQNGDTFERQFRRYYERSSHEDKSNESSR